MPHVTFPADPTDGLVLSVLIGLDGNATAARMAAGQAVPPSLLLRGAIDTCSSVTCIAPRVRLHFGLPLFRSHRTQTVAGSRRVRLYEVSLSIPRPTGSGILLVVERLVVMELPRPLPDLEVLIGWDVVSSCLLISDGPERRFTLSD